MNGPPPYDVVFSAHAGKEQQVFKRYWKYNAPIEAITKRLVRYPFFFVISYSPCTLLIFSCLWSILNVATAQELSTPVFDHYTSSDGLSSNQVHATLRDKQGFLWVATDNGLNRFDGYSFKTYLQIPGDSTSIGNNVVYALAEDAKGYLWVGTGNGLYRYDPLTDRFSGSFLPKTIDASGFDVKQMYMDSEECLWMGASSPVGLFRYDTRNGQFDRFVNDAAQKFGGGNLINDIWKDNNGMIWAGTGNGLFTFNLATRKFNNVLQSSLEKDKQRNFIITSVFQDQYRAHWLWLTTWGDGLWQYDKVTGKSEQFLPEPGRSYNGIHNVLHDLIQPDSNYLWLGSGKLMYFDIGRKQFYDYVQPLETGDIYKFQPDTEGNIWLAGPIGFARLSSLRQQFGLKKMPEPLAVRAILKDTLAGKIYFGTVYYNRSLVIYDEITGNWKTRPLPLLDKWHTGPVKLLKDRRGMLWLLTGKGLFRYDLLKNQIKREEVLLKNGESSTQHLCAQAEEDAAGNIYFRFDNGCVVKYLIANDSLFLSEYRGDALGKTKNGHILLASKKGIIQLPPMGGTGLFIAFPGMAEVSPSAIATDLTGQYWIGTQTSGIFILKPGEAGVHTFRKLDMEDGLPSTWVHQLACDPDGSIWACTRQGLVKIEPKNLSLTVFLQSDGLVSDEFFTELVFLPSGEAFIAHGASPLYHHFDFRKVRRPDLDRLPFYFHTFRIQGKPAVFEKDINHLPVIALNYPDNACSVEFAALTMDGQKSIRYAYRLAGLETHWTDAGNYRYAAYANLPPGNYRLEVRMSNRKGFWSKNIHALNVTVMPAWWQRTWVRVLAGLLFVGLVSFAIARASSVRLRRRVAALERQRELENIRRRIAQDIHDEAGAGLTKIGLTAQVAAHLPPSENTELKRRLDAILTETRTVSARLSEVLFAVNPRYDRLEAIQAWLREWSGRFLEDTGMTAEFDLPKSRFDPVLSPEVKRNLLLILKESLNNAVKYAGSEQVTITLSLDESSRNYLLRVQDFGRGFQFDEVTAFSNGIAGMRNRAEEIGGTLSIRSGAGQGTTVEVKGPLQR